MNTIKVGILGLGRIGKIHLKNLVGRIRQAEVIAAVNPSEGGQNFARKLNVLQVSSDPDIVFKN